jgi:hypothetical protein
MPINMELRAASVSGSVTAYVESGDANVTIRPRTGDRGEVGQQDPLEAVIREFPKLPREKGTPRR